MREMPEKDCGKVKKEKRLTRRSTTAKAKTNTHVDYTTNEEEKQLGEVENPMVIDSVWPDYDAIDRETREEIERQKDDMKYDSRWDY